MKFSLLQSLILAGCFLIAACHGEKNQVHVASKNFGSEVEAQQNLIFNFNKDLYPDSLLQQWDTTEYIELTPKVRGQYKWNSSSELVFSPSEKFRPGQQYTAKLTKNLLTRSKRKYSLSDEIICFRTAPLRVVNTHVSWTRGQSMSNVMVQLDIELNYEVKSEEAIPHLKISSNGKDVLMTTVSSGIGKMLSVQFLPLSEKDEVVPLKIEMTKGIPIATKTYTSEKDTTISTIIPSRFNFAVTSIVAQHSGMEGTIVVNVSQPVNEENLKSIISIEPAVSFDISNNDAGFVITSGDLKADRTYELTISSRIEGVFGGRMKRDHYEQISFGKLEPSIAFANQKGMYLSSKGFKNISLNVVNVKTVEVTLVKVYENNMEHFIRNGKSYGYYYDAEADDNNYNSGSYYYYNTENFGDTVWRGEYETGKLPLLNAARILHLDFQDKIKSYDGVYVITIASKDHKWVVDSKILSLSDIGLIVKEDKDNIYVFANSIRNATPLSNTKISFISTNNQKIFSATTDNSGVAIFRNHRETAPGFKVGLIAAKLGDDYSFVWLKQSEIETSRFDVGGRVPNAAGLNAMIYAERNLYRPGETINVSVVIRDESWNNPGEMPVKLKLIMPNGKEFTTRRKILNEEGAAETSFPIPASAMTGTYILNAYTGNGVLLNSYNFSVEDFVPDRIKATLKISKTEYKVGDSVTAYLQADNLFGTPAAKRNFEMEMNIAKTEFTPKNFSDFDFSIQNNFSYNTQFENGQTNDKGSASKTFSFGATLKDMGVLKGNIMATVFDETGRPIHRYENFSIYTQPIFAGVKLDDYYVSIGSPMRVGLVAVDRNGNVRNTQLLTTLIKKEWHTVIQRRGQRYRYVSQKDEKIVKQQTVNVSDAHSTYLFTPELSGEYELRVAVKGSNSYVSKTFYAWGSGRTERSSFEVNNEGNVTIKPDKDKYKTGEDIDVLFTTPFDGRMLVTLERDKIVEHYVLKTENKSASLKLKADDRLVPNIYIAATLIRPMDGSDMPLTVAHGFKSVSIENPDSRLPVTMSVAPKVRSKSKQTIRIKTQPNAYVTIAAVDEGILQVKNYKTPDPYGYFYQKIALTARSYDIYPLLLPEVKLTRSSTGGDGAEEGAMRVNPMFVNRVKNVSFWSGIMQADSKGNLRYDIDVPQFSGDLRIMAVAYKGKRFGGTDQHMKVADPIIISSALPRFLSPEDEVIMPVTISNTTAQNATAEVKVSVQGPLKLPDATPQKISIPANSERRAVFHVSALKRIGSGKVLVAINALNETFTHETEISIRPAASLQKQFASGTAQEGSPATISAVNNFIPATARGKIIMGKSPLVQFSKNLSALVNYPYGCVEQTISAAFPQLYYRDLVKSISGQENHDPNPAHNVQQAILKLQSMQLSNGSLAYWPGGSESWWGSVYAAHFLIEARKAGYEVSLRVTDQLLQYIKYRLTRKETEILYYNDYLKKEIAAKEIPYSLYVLALAGQHQISTMNYYKAHKEILSIEGKYLLAGAYSLAGQKTQAKEVLPQAFSGEKANQTFSGNFYSYIRDQALALNTLLDTDPDNSQIGIMSRQLSADVRGARHLNTQENVWTILAFGKIARRANSTNATATLLAGGKSIASTKDMVAVDLKPYLNKNIQLQINGKGRYYYFVELSGITADGSFKEEDSYLKVRRTFFDRNGKEIANNSFRQNDLIVVRISLQSQYNNNVENVAITDMLPAGLEIENTRLNDMPDIKWITEQDEPDYVDFRDDRVNFFTTATQRPKYFYYLVRAVSPGKYKLGPVQADAMYDGSYHSYNGGGIVYVSEK